MKSKQDIVSGGGGVARESAVRPKPRFFACLLLVWLVVGAGSLPWLGSTGLAASCALELLFIVLAVVFSLVEAPRTIVQHLPNLNADEHNLLY